jgi:hypothetical protein
MSNGAQKLPDAARDILFRKARSYDAFAPDAELLPDGRFKSNFLCNLGKGDANKLSPLNPRFRFDEVCRIIEPSS